jgi:stage II sporulation protein M
MASGLTIFVFCVAVAIGVGMVWYDSSIGGVVLEILGEELFDQILDDNSLIISIKIFLNNLIACLLLFAGGATFGIITLFILIANGIIIGIVLEAVRVQEGIAYVLVAIVPHGIFELPALFISGALGFCIAEALWNEWHDKGDAAETARGHFRVFIRIVIPLVAVAALIEAFITPQILNLLL